MSLAALIWLLVASALAAGTYRLLLTVAVPHPGPNGGRAVIDPLDVIKTTITVAGFFGAVLVGVYGYRKQRLTEGDAHRADAEQLAQRYTTAAEQLGHEKAAVRLAGVHAMARLADDWVEQRQVCIDVLCAYLRMPYEPDTANEKHREGEREVRLTIIRTIRDHLQNPAAPTTWCGRDLNFTGATFDGGDFFGAQFIGGAVSFSLTEFSGGAVSFERAEFAGGEISFFQTKFAGGSISFHRARFNGGKVIFFEAQFTASKVSFYETRFTSSEISFEWARFGGGHVLFHFAKFVGGEISFQAAEHADATVSFDHATFDGSDISWGPFEPPAAWTALQEQKR